MYARVNIQKGARRMTLHSQPLAFSGSFSQNIACWRAVSHSKGCIASKPGTLLAVATLPSTEVDGDQPLTAFDAQRHAAGIARSKVSRLSVPFVGSGRTGTVAVRQRLLQDHIKVHFYRYCYVVRLLVNVLEVLSTCATRVGYTRCTGVPHLLYHACCTTPAVPQRSHTYDRFVYTWYLVPSAGIR